jgi:hypothetical protein
MYCSIPLRSVYHLSLAIVKRSAESPDCAQRSSTGLREVHLGSYGARSRDTARMDVDQMHSGKLVRLEITDTQDGTKVTSTIKNTYSGEEEEITSSVLVACDGAKSRIVESLGIPSEVEESGECGYRFSFVCPTVAREPPPAC